MDVDLREHIFDPTMSVVTRTSTARVPECPPGPTFVTIFINRLANDRQDKCKY